MAGGREEARSAPGELRDIQNYITGGGEVIYTPPPPDRMLGCLDNLFGYVDSRPDAPPLVEIAWVHYAFEAIHPFRDGNGRVGRILIPLLLARRRGLEHPLLLPQPVPLRAPAGVLRPPLRGQRAQRLGRLAGVHAARRGRAGAGVRRDGATPDRPRRRVAAATRAGRGHAQCAPPRLADPAPVPRP